MAAPSTTPQIVLPGDTLGSTTRAHVGVGAHIAGGSVASSLAGTLSSSSASSGKQSANTTKNTAAVSRPFAPPLPTVHSIVLGRIIRVRQREAHISLDVVDGRAAASSSSSTTTSTRTTGTASTSSSSHYGTAAAGSGAGEPFTGIIRVQDVRATEKDRVRMGECFRVGDVVRAEVVGVGDERAFLCSTARNELGVVLATADGGEGAALYARSWREMVDQTGVVERRKVARPG